MADYRRRKADDVTYPWWNLEAGMYSRSHTSERPPNSLDPASRNVIRKHEHWRRKGGRSTYNPLAIPEPTANNIAHWRLNDNLGDTDVVDASGNAHTGTASANTSTLHATAKVGTGSFDFGGSKYVTVADDDTLSFDDSDDKAFSLAAWVYVEAGTAEQVIISKWDETDGAELREWKLSLTATEKPILTLCDESADKLPTETADDALSAGWHHIVVTYDGGGGATAMAGVTIYVDGSAVDSTGSEEASYVAMENTASAVIIGALEGTDGNMGLFLKEKGDDVRILNKVLSTTEVTFLYNLGNGTESLLVEQELRGLDHFNDGTTNALLALCDANFYKTSGNTLMGTALTEPDGTAVAVASADNDIEGVQIRNRTYLFNGDTADEPWVFDGTNIINYAVGQGATGTADGAGTTTTIVDANFAGSPGDDDYNGQYIEITDAVDGTIYRGYVTDFDESAPRTVTFSPARDTATATGDTFIVGVAGQEERNGKYPILHMDRIFVAVGSLVYFTEPGYPDVWSSIVTGLPNIKYPGWNDGEDITAMASMDEYVIIFKPHHIYAMRTIGDSLFWPMPRIVGTDSNKGCVWHRTLDRGFGGLIYMSWDGAYVLDRSLNVQCVSNNIEPTIQALVQSTSNISLALTEKIDTTAANFDAGTKTNIDTTTTSGSFQVALTTEAVDATYATGGDADADNYSQDIAQSFKPSINCFCTALSLSLKKHDTGTTCTFYLKDDDGNQPGDTLGSISITAVGATYADKKGSFSTAIELTAGTRYWIQMARCSTTAVAIYWQLDSTAATYANGNYWWNGNHYTDRDFLFKVHEQHYESSSNLVSRIHNLGAVPAQWGIFEATETLNGCTVVYQVRSDDDSAMGSPTAWTTVENGGTPDITLQQYVQSKTINTPTNVATPVIDDITIRAFVGAAVSPCAKVWDKGYLLCVADAGSTVNNVAYRLDEDTWMRERRELWSPKLTGISATKFIIFNDQLMSGSVGGEGLGGFIYYEDSGTKDLGSDFTTTLITKKHDFSDLNPTFRDRNKIFRKSHSKYKSQQDASLYYKTDASSWSSAITLSAHANASIEKDWLVATRRGVALTLKVEQTVADPDWEWHGSDIEMSVLRMR